MNLDEAAKYAAYRDNPNHHPHAIRYWKSRIVLASMRGLIQIDENDNLDQAELDVWMEGRAQRLIKFDRDLDEKLRELKGYGAISDFVNQAVREKLTRPLA